MCVEESVHVIFDESNTISKEDVLVSKASAEEHTVSQHKQVEETCSSNTVNREGTETRKIRVDSYERVYTDENQLDVNEEQNREYQILF